MSRFEKRLDCPLRDRLAKYFVDDMKMAPDEATRHANEFMQGYLEYADRGLVDRDTEKQSRSRLTRDLRRAVRT